MAAAVVKFNKSINGGRFAKSEKVKVKKFVAATNHAARRKTFIRKVLFWFGSLSILLAALAAGAFYYFYSQAAAIVDQRVKLGFWQTRSGIYAAPHTLNAGQKIKTEELVAILRHAGYVEGENKNIWNGNFTVAGDRVTIQTNHSADELPETITVEVSQAKIASIKNDGRKLDTYELQPEMISGNSETKRDSVNTLKFEQIPENLRNAIIVTEDRRFFEHGGIDFRGVFRALRQNVAENEITQGGSTITQQYVKNVFLSGEKTFERKFSEAFLALALENRMSKEDIFALYCNEIYLGQYGATGIHGVEQASRAYFGKNIEKLTLGESAMLAAMIKSPGKYAPNRDLSAAKQRRNSVLQKMLEENVISAQQSAQAQTEEIALAPPPKNDKVLAPYFIDSVVKQLTAKKLPERNLRVYSTIDPQLQEMAEASISRRLAELNKFYAKKGVAPQAALVALNPQNGHVLAMVGGRDYAESQMNRATDARRQPGSTFKPFVYAAALENGKLPTTVVADKPMEFAIDRNKFYKPANYGNSYAMHEITLKSALAKSSNVVAVETALESGLGNVVRTAEKFGLPKPLAYPSIALGTSEVSPLELASAYATFANDGKRVKPVFVSKIISGDGQIVFENDEEKNAPVVSPQTAYMITDMLGAAVERGTARAANGALGKNVAFVGKTGSSKDGWFVGYTPNLVCLVWIGFDEGGKDIEMTGGEAALPAWVDFMQNTMQARPEFGGEAFPMPAGLTQVTIDPETGMLADEHCPLRETAVVPSKYFSNLICLRHQPKIDVITADYTLPESFETNSTTAAVYETTIPAAIEEKFDDENDSINVDSYKSINGVPTRVKSLKTTEKSDDFEEYRPEREPKTEKTRRIVNRDEIEENTEESLK